MDVIKLLMYDLFSGLLSKLLNGGQVPWSLTGSRSLLLSLLHLASRQDGLSLRYINLARPSVDTSLVLPSHLNMVLKVFVIAVLVAVTIADTIPYTPPHPSYNAPAPTGPAQYNFDWSVNDANSGNDYGHNEGRNGYDTQGSYYVQLPDGRLQRVTYTVNGDSGYVAQVEYEGEAQYSAYQPAPSYQPAPPYRPAPTYTPTPSYN
ncbi:Pro-resilin-like 171 [Homarus americanus]|uniref:Pro-resilin-like 171 n=1 Tax=Homarus americanus TaxID=6706 RepID=A0A8J5MTA5_HOMAM|nr:Pro-resilin-like 171 [Homarus americanus]